MCEVIQPPAHITAAPLPLSLASQAWLPESPRWLLLSGARQAEVSTALRRTKGTAATAEGVDAELNSMLEAILSSPKAESSGGGALGERAGCEWL